MTSKLQISLPPLGSDWQRRHGSRKSRKVVGQNKTLPGTTRLRPKVAGRQLRRAERGSQKHHVVMKHIHINNRTTLLEGRSVSGTVSVREPICLSSWPCKVNLRSKSDPQNWARLFQTGRSTGVCVRARTKLGCKKKKKEERSSWIFQTQLKVQHCPLVVFQQQQGCTEYFTIYCIQTLASLNVLRCGVVKDRQAGVAVSSPSCCRPAPSASWRSPRSGTAWGQARGRT